VLIEFNHPRLESTVGDFDKLCKLMDKSSCLVGFLISLGKQFVNSKTKDLDEEILPKIRTSLQGDATSRICIGYGILMWFVLKVYRLFCFISIKYFMY